MDDSRRGVAARSLLALFAAIVIALVSSSWPARADDRDVSRDVFRDVYVDRALGFSFSKPRFAPSLEPGASTVAVAISGAATHGFSPNLNVVVNNLKTTLDAYQALQKQELSSAGWNLLEQSKTTIHGTPALRTHARGSFRGLEIEYLAVTIVEENERVYVLTCTATTDQFPDLQAEFDRVASSFSLEPQRNANP